MRTLIILTFIFAHNFFSYSQEGISFGIENSVEFNFQPVKKNNGSKPFSVFHEQIVVCSDIAQHRIFLGPQYTYFSGHLYDPNDAFQKNAFGLNFGYQYHYLIKNKLENTSIITRLSFSLYEYKTTEFSLGSGNIRNVNTILENNLYVGFQKQFHNKLYLQGGIGLGSTDGFFLMLQSFMLSSTFGFGIKF